jgi:hypothetical protein
LSVSNALAPLDAFALKRIADELRYIKLFGDGLPSWMAVQ